MALSTFAILPVKGFDRAKQRLAGGLSPGPRQALVEAMFADVLVALRRTRGVERTVVVTGDRGAQRIAAGYGAEAIDDAGEGHVQAAMLGIEHVLERGARRALLVPGDCPLLDPLELDALLAASAAAPGVVIVPDRHGTGTNALLLSPPGAMQPAFGPGSCALHVAAARAARLQPDVELVDSLALDIDTPEDLEALRARFAATHGGAAHTRGMLGQLDRSSS